MTTPAEIQAAVDKIPVNLGRLDAIINGPAEGAGSIVTVDGGVQVKTLARLVLEGQVSVDDASGFAAAAEAARDEAVALAAAFSTVQLRIDENDPNWPIAAVDENDNISFGVRPDGTFFGAGLDQLFADPRFTDIMHFIVHGQSLGEGADSFPVVSNTPSPWGSVMFARGNRTWTAAEAHSPEARTGFTLTAMQQLAAGGLGETIMNGMLDGLKASLRGLFNPKDQVSLRPLLLGSFAGRGSTRLTALNKEDSGQVVQGTSTTSVTIGVGTKNLTTQTGLGWTAGDAIRIERVSNAIYYMSGGTVQSYDSGTGALVVQGITIPSGNGQTFSDWRLLRDDWSAPGNYYNTLLDDVEKGLEQAALLQMTYSVAAIIWMQGERNGDYRIYEWEAPSLPSVALASYTAKLKILADDLDTDIRAKTGQPRRIPFLTYQTASLMGPAQLTAANEHPDIFLVGSTSHLPRALDSKIGTGNPGQRWGDRIHLHGDGTRIFGEMTAKVLRRVLFEKKDWSPLQPLRAVKVDARTFDVQFHVPVPPLVLDVTQLAKCDGWGFTINTGSVDALVSVTSPVTATVIAMDTVRFTTTTDLPANALLSAGTTFVNLGVTMTVAALGTGANTADGWPTHTIKIAGDQTAILAPLINRGAFDVGNGSGGGASAVIRSVTLDGSGDTILTGEVRERTGVFGVGQTLQFSHPVLGINLRDSDNELAVNSYSDPLYPQRTGRYPLQNWCVQFPLLPIQGT